MVPCLRKITEELTYEKESAVESEPEFLKQFKSAGVWTVCFLLNFFFTFGDIGIDLFHSLDRRRYW